MIMWMMIFIDEDEDDEDDYEEDESASEMTSTEGTTTSQASEPSETTTVDSNQVDIAEEMPDPSAQGSDNEESGESDDIEETPDNSVNENEGTEALLDNEQTAIKLSCVKNGIEYMNGDTVYHENPCQLCQCTNGEIVCVTEECTVPDASDNCMKIDPAPIVPTGTDLLSRTLKLLFSAKAPRTQFPEAPES